MVFGGVGWAHSGRDGLSCALQEADLLLEAHPRAGGPGPLGSLVPPPRAACAGLNRGHVHIPASLSRGDLDVTRI